MKEKMTTAKGFTLVEIIMVIVILGIVGIVAIPFFTDAAYRAQEAAKNGVVGGVRSGITSSFVSSMPPAYPASLDAASSGACSTSNPCFGNVLSQGGVRDSTWQVMSPNVYEHTSVTMGGSVVKTRYAYTPPPGVGAGTFACTSGQCQ